MGWNATSHLNSEKHEDALSRTGFEEIWKADSLPLPSDWGKTPQNQHFSKAAVGNGTVCL